ncbi:GNAT family N-acetyltransferase [Ancylobacter sp.]|uniref:GNAT family N-acetyltransferase n=1 Tax=Ancylobacter sp. TaxID=1872567 RepID=UPI003D0A35B4
MCAQSQPDPHRWTAPDALAGFGVALRPETPEDVPFLAALFESVRWPAFDDSGWTDSFRRAFLAEQFRFQVAHYARACPDAVFLIVERRSVPIGRLYVHEAASEHRIVDISLLPEVRNQGLGGALLDMVCAAADRRGCLSSLHVEKFNRARSLYRRKGFKPAGERGPYWLMIREPESRAAHEAPARPSADGQMSQR